MSTPTAKFCEFFVRWAAVSGALGPFGLPRLRPAGGAAAARAGSRAANGFWPRPAVESFNQACASSARPVLAIFKGVLIKNVSAPI